VDKAAPNCLSGKNLIIRQNNYKKRKKEKDCVQNHEPFLCFKGKEAADEIPRLRRRQPLFNPLSQLEESLKQKLLVFAISKSCGSRKASSFHSALFSTGTSETSRITVSVHISFSVVLLIFLSERPAVTLTAPNNRRDTRKRNTQNVIFLRYLTE
jgi:hypothetical protein